MYLTEQSVDSNTHVVAEEMACDVTQRPVVGSMNAMSNQFTRFTSGTSSPCALASTHPWIFTVPTGVPDEGQEATTQNVWMRPTKTGTLLEVALRTVEPSSKTAGFCRLGSLVDVATWRMIELEAWDIWQTPFSQSGRVHQKPIDN